MDGGFYFTAVGRIVSASGCGIVGAVDFDHFALFVLHDALAGDEIAVAQADFASGRQAKIFRRRNFAKIVLLDVEGARERHLARARAGILGIVDRFHFFGLVLGIIVDHDLQRAQDGHGARGAFVEIFANEVLEHG